MLMKRVTELTLTTAFALVLTGCTGSNSEFTEVGHDESEVADMDHSGHGHGHHGPNGGDIVEVGNEEYHAEVTVDEASNRVDVYILGSDAKTAKPIESTEISLSFKHGEEVEDFKLAAAALDGEPEGQSSKFTLTSEEFFEELHEHSEGATLTFTAGEETLTGTVHHSHEHGDHEHGDHDHDHGEKHADGDHDEEGHKHGKDHDADGDEHGKDEDSKKDSDGDKAESKDEAAADEPEPAPAKEDSEKEAAAEKKE